MSSGLFSFGARKSARGVHATHPGRFRGMPFHLRVKIYLIHFELSIMQTHFSSPQCRPACMTVVHDPSSS